MSELKGVPNVFSPSKNYCQMDLDLIKKDTTIQLVETIKELTQA